MKTLHRRWLLLFFVVLFSMNLETNLFSQDNDSIDDDFINTENDKYIIYPETVNLINKITLDVSTFLSKHLLLNREQTLPLTLAIKDILQNAKPKKLTSIKQEQIETIILDMINNYDKDTLYTLIESSQYKIFRPILLESNISQKTLSILYEILEKEEFLDFLTEEDSYIYLENASFFTTLSLLNDYSDDSTLSEILLREPNFFVEINNIAGIISSLKTFFNEEDLTELFNSSIFLKHLHKNSLDLLKNVQFFSKYYSSKSLKEKLCNDPESITFKLSRNIPSNIMDNILSIFSSILSSEEIIKLIDADFFIKIDHSFQTIPEDTNLFYRNLKYIFILISKDKSLYVETFPEFIQKHFSYFVELSMTVDNFYTLEKKIIEFKYNNSISYKLFELNDALDFVPVFFELFLDNVNSETPSNYVFNKSFIIDTIDSWISEEYLTEEFNSFLEGMSPLDSLDLLLVLYVLHNNVPTDDLRNIISTNFSKLFIFKDFIYTISVYLKDNDLIKQFLSNSKMIVNFFNTSWDEESSLEYFKHIISIANLLPEKDRTSFILNIDTFYPIPLSEFKAHIELIHFIKDKYKDNFNTILGPNYKEALNYAELKSLSSTLFEDPCVKIMTEEP